MLVKMRGKKYYKTEIPQRKIIIKHFCRECGELYCVRTAPGSKNDENILIFCGYCCEKCAQSLDDIAPGLLMINYVTGTEAGKFNIKSFERKLMK